MLCTVMCVGVQVEGNVVYSVVSEIQVREMLCTVMCV